MTPRFSVCAKPSLSSIARMAKNFISELPPRGEIEKAIKDYGEATSWLRATQEWNTADECHQTAKEQLQSARSQLKELLDKIYC